MIELPRITFIRRMTWLARHESTSSPTHPINGDDEQECQAIIAMPSTILRDNDDDDDDATSLHTPETFTL